MLGLSKLLAYILAAGGPPVQLARVRWPMHRALYETWAEAGRRGDRHCFGLRLEFRPSAESGFAAVGADAALEALIGLGVLRPQGKLRNATLAFDRDAAVQYRRELMALPAEHVFRLQLAGERWAAFASTALKNRSTASRSSESTVSSGMPKCANLSLPGSA
jgi:hypothetical protein